MRILFDQGTPAPLRHALASHQIDTAFEMGWSNLDNGHLLQAAEGHFQLLITTDKNLRFQQNVTGRSLAILVLPTTNWLKIRAHEAEIAATVESMQSGEYRELRFAR